VHTVCCEERAKALITLGCNLSDSGEYYARELAQEQTLDNLAIFGERLADTERKYMPPECSHCGAGKEVEEPDPICDCCNGKGLMTGLENSCYTAPKGFSFVERCDNCLVHDGDIEAALTFNCEVRILRGLEFWGGVCIPDSATLDESGKPS